MWGEGDQTRQIIGAQNYYAPTSRTSRATSAETFAQIYRFFTGHQPKTTDVVPQRGRIRLSGEANVFPQNQGADGFTLQIFEIDRRTGRREHRRPDATFAIGPDGAWGPFKAHAGERYEFALTRTDGSVHHLYFQPFLRSDHLVRLLDIPAGRGPRPAEGSPATRPPASASSATRRCGATRAPTTTPSRSTG